MEPRSRSSDTNSYPVFANGFDGDDEMREVFRHEADDLLRSVADNLDRLANAPLDHKALWEIRRNAHTFKGAAGIVGLKKASELAHRVEDLLDRMAETNTPADSRLLDLLNRSAVLMQTIVEGSIDFDLDSHISTVCADFESAVAALKTSVTASLPAAPLTHENVSVAPAKKKAVARVSLERIDEVNKTVQNLAFNQSAFAKKLRELGCLSDELQSCLRHLQNATATIETDVFNHFGEFDPQILHELTDVIAQASLVKESLNTTKDDLEFINESQRQQIEKTLEQVHRIRLISFGTLSPRLVRTVKVLCEEENKQAELIVENSDLELDTETLDSLAEPLLHLLKNAVVHGIEPPEIRRSLNKSEIGTIILRLENTEKRHIFTISDDGCGICVDQLRRKAIASNIVFETKMLEMTDDEIRQFIFIPGLSTAGELNMNAGRGVGMNIVKESIESRGGTVSVASRSGIGTEFTLRMPNISPLSHNIKDISTTRINVLIVDDSRTVRELTAKTMREAGWQVKTATNGQEALEMLANSVSLPSIILTDLEMPHLDGYGLLSALKSADRFRGIPVVMISSRFETKYRKTAFELGVSEYLTKPLDDSNLIEIASCLIG